MYKTIIFDLDNTLLNYEQCELNAMQRTLQDHGLTKIEQIGDFWEVYPKHSYRHWIDFVNGGAVKNIRDVLVYSFRDALGLDDKLHEQLADTYWDYFCHICIFEEGAEDVLTQLKKTFQLGIITNGISESQRKRMKAGKISDHFAGIVISDEVGVRKPNKEIFNIAMEQLNAASGEVLYVGDSLADDYEGTINVGIDFCLYNRKNVPIPEGVSPKFIIHDLKELITVLHR